MNILYIGPNNSEWAQYNRPVSLAAAKWSRGFLGGLSKECNITVLTHSHEHIWPKGNVLWRGFDSRLYPDTWPCVAVSYPSLYKIREIWLRAVYPIVAKKIVKARKIDVAIFYNCYTGEMLSTMRMLHSLGVPCIPIILDGDDPRKDDWRWLKRAARYSKGFVSLSWWIYENLPKHIPGKLMYHMDGGADGWRGQPPTDAGDFAPVNNHIYKLVHTGALDQWRGFAYMVEVVKCLSARRKDVKFVFCGKSSVKALYREFGDNPFVELPGLVTEEEMARICNSADVLLNVRTPDHPDNILNYPSKLPHYLSFGRPVISTRLQSLSPDYAEVVNFPKDDSVEAYVDKIEQVLTWTKERRLREYSVIKEWFACHKRWDVLAKGLVDWLKANR